MWNNRQVSVIFPAYNEAPNIQTAVREYLSLKGVMGHQLIDEVLVVDNNSTDSTGDIAQRAGARVVKESNQGYGYALQRGLDESIGDLVVLAEPDGTFLVSDIFKLLAYSDDFEMVCGTRTTSELIWSEANMGWFLRIGNNLVAKLMQILYGMPSISDCGCTFRLISKRGIELIKSDLHVGGSHFLPNMLIAARHNRLNFVEIPLNYRPRIGESKITGSWSGTWKTGLRMLFLIAASWPNFIMHRIRLCK